MAFFIFFYQECQLLLGYYERCPIIERNFNLDIKNPYMAEQINHDPEELLAEYAP